MGGAERGVRAVAQSRNGAGCEREKTRVMESRFDRDAQEVLPGKNKLLFQLMTLHN